MSAATPRDPGPSAAPVPPSPPPRATPVALPFGTRASIFLRLLAIQASWNYEILLGTGIGFCTEPALRLLPGGKGGPAYRAALARHSQYFNAHPYLAAVAVGALIRAELDGTPPARIERFRTALCGPLGSVGDRLVWAAWLPFCSLVGLLLFGLGAGPGWVVGGFLVLYNVGHFALRAWGLRVGLERGMQVAGALGNPVLRYGPQWLSQAAAFTGGAALPLALSRAVGSGRVLLGGVVATVVIGAVLITRLHGRVEGWRVAIGALAAFVLYSLLR
ncbi:PTS system mannose/fructose/sorbose family transporter subunit IID [Roseisolibacter agri]|uniref:PTS system mannose/fructose/sorbose family transporter subunit IID n=1 Tax=Roseisolibacter agri TaxID=2014610 RepID=UPI0024E18620|nr:PTS system mannose/fructose/sorbose family transporter subunit IID [Roseisolibacter agri]